VGTRRALVEPGAAPEELKVLAAYAGVVIGIGIVLAEHVLDD
jgi:capsular polysaccharide biosynthesis protein